MKVLAKLNYLRIAPRKVRLVADLIRGKSVEEAEAILNFTLKEATRPLLKLLKSATASAKHNLQLEERNLYISKIMVNEGPKLKRWRAESRGRVGEIQKKASHIMLELSQIREVSKSKAQSLSAEKRAKVGLRKLTKRAGKASKPKSFESKPGLKMTKPKFKKTAKKIFRRKAF